jgi:hypothetical protein
MASRLAHILALLGREPVKRVVIVLDKANRGLREDDRPLERSSVQALALLAMAVFCVQGVSMDLKRD